MSSLVLITGFVDINREQWNVHNRKSNDYLQYMRNVCQLKNHMIIWIEPSLTETIKQYRSNVGNEWMTIINPFQLEDCILWSNKSRIEDIITSYKTKKWEHDKASIAPEYTQPLYDIIVNQKIDWIKKSKEQCERLKLAINYYVWIDSGYGHGSIDLNGSIEILPECKDKISMIRIWRWPFFQNIEEFQFHWPIDVLSGGMIIIDSSLIETLNLLYYGLLDKWLKRGIIDDDQVVMTFIMNEFPSIFHLIHGDWYSEAKIFFKSNTSKIVNK